MSMLELPPRVRAEIAKDKHKAERERRWTHALELLDFDDPVCREWQPHLQQLDPHLLMARALPRAEDPDLNIRAGFFHWVRKNPREILTCEPITAPDGESFALPDGSLLNNLRANDLQNPAVVRDMFQRQLEAEAAKERDEAEAKQRRVDGTIERYKRGNNAHVSMTPGWSATNAGRKGRKAKDTS